MLHSRRNFFRATALGTALAAIPCTASHAALKPQTKTGVVSAKPSSIRLRQLSHRTRRAMRFAVDEASDANNTLVDSTCLLIGLAAEAEYSGAYWLTNLGLSLDDLCGVRKRLTVVPPQPTTPRGRIPLSEAARQCVTAAMREADRMGYKKAEPEHMLLGLLQKPDVDAHLILHEMWIEPSALEEEALASMPTWSSLHHRFT